jgi:acetyl-CoA C-acetyltransferase
MTTMDPHTPVLVGVGTAVHRPDDGPTPDPIALMADAAREAGRDGAESLLAEVGWLGVPKGTWTHPDPTRALTDACGLGEPHTVVAEVGVLQQTVIARAVEAVGAGAPAALVVGGEAAHGSAGEAAAAVAGSILAEATGPDERWTTDDYGISHEEMVHGFVDPPSVYAVIESALAHEAGRSPVQQREHLGRLQARFAAVAATNPDAWRREVVEPDAIATPDAGNRLVAAPYTKLCCSNLRVNQAAALLVTTVDRAREAGVAEEAWVFPLTSTESNLSVPVLHRPELHRSPGAALAGERALSLAGITADTVDHLELYSCFPAAVEVFAAELGLDPGRPLTVTGGMTFAGGPLNNYVLQSTAAMARVLRADPGSSGLVTSVSGMITKQGFAVWSTTPPSAGFRSVDVTAEVRDGDERRAETGSRHGAATVVGHTVVHDRDGPVRALAVAETPDGSRLITASTDPEVMAQFGAEDRVGADHEVRGTTVLLG